MALQHLRSSTANKRPLPAGMSDGQIAVNTNTASPGLFFKDSAGNLVKTGPVHVGTTAPNASPASGGATGNSTGELWLDTSVSPNQLKTWNGSAWVSDFPDEIPVAKLADGAARQLLQTDAAGTGVEWTSNIDVPGTLDVTSTATFDNIASHPLGSAGAPTITFTGDTNTGIYSPGADQVAISTAGSGRLFVNSAGRVGIGTASSIAPSAPLDDLHIASTDPVVLLEETDAGTDEKYWRIRADGSILRFEGINDAFNSTQTWLNVTRSTGARTVDNIAFSTGTNERARIDSSGRLGIGTSAPNERLSVEVNGTTNRAIEIYNGDTVLSDGELVHAIRFTQNDASAPNTTHASIETVTTGSTGLLNLVFKARDNTEYMRIDHSGNVGIGTTSPSAPLTIESSAGNQVKITYPSIASYFLNATSGGDFAINKDGTERARIDSSGRLLVGTSTSSATCTAAFASRSDAAAAPLIALHTTESTVTNGANFGTLSFGNTASSGTNAGAFIQAQRDGGTWTNNSSMPGRLTFSTTADGASSPTERMRIHSNGDVGIGLTGQYPGDNNTTNGVYFENNGKGFFSKSAAVPLLVNRNTNDGDLVEFRQAGTLEGTISVSGTTVSYNGAHLSRWSQLPPGQKRTEILRGSVLSNIDEMCEWGDEENEQLNRMKVSDVEGDKNVSGVFQAWDDDDDTYTNDFYCAMTGDFIIRIGAGVTVERGDLLMSAGDGTAKPQDDDIIRSRTIAKVTSTNVSCTYDDGSYCVPCVLMAC